MHKSAPVLENDTHKLLWDFDIHTDHPNLGQKTRPNNNQQKKKKKKKKEKKRELVKLWTLLSRLATE